MNGPKCGPRKVHKMKQRWLQHTELQIEYDHLVERWQELRMRPFPQGWSEADSKGYCLPLLDSDMFAAIESFIHRRWLSARALSGLSEIAIQLHEIAPILEGDAAQYFAEFASCIKDTIRFWSEQNKTP
ncbi:MAG: hypothetical protein DHS20C16_32170 [Phycisphaerae bacterium]|nr:MAG: hypothetical protein DHS20C16_32170 [Phycisphaerae bacterium]